VEFQSTRRNECLVLALKGRLDTISAPDFLKDVDAMITESESRVLCDLSDLEYMSSAGLRAVLIIAKKCKGAGGELTCVGLQDMVKRVFDVSGFSSLVPVCATIEEAFKDG
jgi:anti-anti-sigma factor